MDRVNIIVLKYKVPELEAKCVESIIKYTNHPYLLSLHDSRHEDSNMSRMWNMLIKQSPCDYVLIMDSDCEVTRENWLYDLKETLNRDAGIACVLPKTENVSTPAQMEGTGVIDLEMPTGNCMLFRKNIFQALGHFDEEFDVFGQDSEWFNRAYRAGYRLKCNRDVFVKHVGNASTKKAADEGEYNWEEELKKSNKLYTKKRDEPSRHRKT